MAYRGKFVMFFWAGEQSVMSDGSIEQKLAEAQRYLAEAQRYQAKTRRTLARCDAIMRNAKHHDYFYETGSASASASSSCSGSASGSGSEFEIDLDESDFDIDIDVAEEDGDSESSETGSETDGSETDGSEGEGEGAAPGAAPAPARLSISRVARERGHRNLSRAELRRLGEESARLFRLRYGTDPPTHTRWPEDGGEKVSGPSYTESHRAVLEAAVDIALADRGAAPGPWAG